jgi:hypothetical protein
MRMLHATGLFCSLTYRDMPFVLAPNVWASLANRGARHKDAADRAHGDGVMVDFESPEALEDVFWRIFCGDRYIQSNRLSGMVVDSEDAQRFRTYVSLILKRYSGNRYLSKNNNNIVRLKGIQSTFPKALILVPYRSPAQHAFSLLKQHQRFVELHKEDPFSAKYMTWLVHHEFGSDHRPFEWGREFAAGRNPMSMDYWLAQWFGVYSYLLHEIMKSGNSLLPISDEILCTETDRVWDALKGRAGFSVGTRTSLDLRIRELPAIKDQQLLQKAETVYESLVDQTMRWL